jgi:hypothetical protein
LCQPATGDTLQQATLQQATPATGLEETQGVIA